ncbi:MAG: FtsQ-type POTRA domain-containing protein [Smithellaceae bacterium]
MTKKIRASLEARKNRMRRRLIGGTGEFLCALGLLLSSAVIGLLFVYGYSYLLSCPYFEIREVAVRGVKELTQKDILDLAGVSSRQNILAVSTGSVANRVLANPWIKQVRVGRELPDRLVLDVRERNPVALVKQNGGFYLMDGEGYVFKRLSRGDDVDLAIITGVELKDSPRSELLHEALALLELIAASEQDDVLGMVSEVSVDEVFGLSVLTDKGLHLKLGVDQYEEKLRQLGLVMADLEKRGLKRGHLFVDLADVSKITVQRKEESGKIHPGKKGPQYRI